MHIRTETGRTINKINTRKRCTVRLTFPQIRCGFMQTKGVSNNKGVAPSFSIVQGPVRKTDADLIY